MGIPVSLVGNDPIDAGEAINLSGPSGTATITPSNGGIAFEFNLIPNTGGTINFDNGVGGVDVGTFTTRITIPAPLVWTNQRSIGSVNRAEGVTLTWSGGAPNMYVTIMGGPGLGPYFNCSTRVSAQRFTVPATVLLSLPASATVAANSFLELENVVNTQTFAAPKLDVGFVSAT